MAGFKTHVTTSTVLGVGYAGAGYWSGLPLESAMVAGGMCGVAGMFPDIDSGSGRPVREVMGFAAAVIPMLLMGWFKEFHLTNEEIVLAGGLIYLVVRFGVAEWIRSYTVHRGMFHSIPAALIFAGLAFLMSGGEDLHLRYYKAGAVLLGVMSHLILDELYSIEWYRGRLRFKSSFGTAVKFWGKSLWANVSTYAKLAVVIGMICSEPMVMERFGTPMPDDIYRTAEHLLDTVIPEQH